MTLDHNEGTNRILYRMLFRIGCFCVIFPRNRNKHYFKNHIIHKFKHLRNFKILNYYNIGKTVASINEFVHHSDEYSVVVYKYNSIIKISYDFLPNLEREIWTETPTFEYIILYFFIQWNHLRTKVIKISYSFWYFSSEKYSF